jgi:hypothetical protein
MIKWNYRATRVALVLGAIAAFAIASGAQTKWAVAHPPVPGPRHSSADGNLTDKRFKP